MGRDLRLASPVNTAVMGVVAIAPITRREPVPELPKSSSILGLFQLPTPVPVTRQRPGPSAVSSAPSPRRAPAVEWTSPDSSRPVMRVSPSARAPTIRARWAMDLAPGTWAVPLRGPARRAASGAGLALSIRGFKRPLQAGLPVANAPLQQPLLHGKHILVKADLGTKRACPSCNARFYDLTKRPIECPKCGFSYEPEALFKQRRSRVAEPAAGVVPATNSEDEEEEDEDDDNESESEDEEEEVETVQEAPLNVAATGEDEDEETEEEEAEAESGMSVVDADEAEDIEDIEVEDDEDEEDDDLLGEVEDEEEDVSGIIDPGISKDES